MAALVEFLLDIPIVGWIILAGLATGYGIYRGIEIYAPQLLPTPKGTGLKGFLIDSFNTLSPVVKLNPDGTPTFYQNLLDIVNWASKQEDPYKPPVFKEPNEGKTAGELIGKALVRCDTFSFPLNYVCKIGVTVPLLPGVIYTALKLDEIGFTPDKLINSIFNIPNQINDFWKWLTSPNDNIKIPGDYTINDSMNISDLFNKLNNTPKITSNPNLMMINIPGVVNGIVNGANELGGLISDNASRIGSWISGGIGNATNAINNFVNNAVTNARDQIAQGVAQAVTAAQTTYHAAAQVAQATYKAAVNASQAVYTGVVHTGQAIYYAGQTAYHAAVHAGQTIYKAAVHFGQTAYKAVVHTGQTIYNAAVHAGQAVYNTVSSGVNWFRGLIGW